MIKTDLCQCTEYRIYSDHRQKFIAKSRKAHPLINAKADLLFHPCVKPVKLSWTQAWRRMDKKGKTDDHTLKCLLMHILWLRHPATCGKHPCTGVATARSQSEG